MKIRYEAAVCLLVLATQVACKRTPDAAHSRAPQKTIATIQGLSVLEPGDQVLDPKTGLIWARCSLGEAWNGSACEGRPRMVTLDEATEVTPPGWRIPSIRELSTLVYCETNQYHRGDVDLGDGPPPLESACIGNKGPALHPAFVAGPYDLTYGLSYWSATTYRGNDQYNYTIFFKHGQVNGVPKKVPVDSEAKSHVRFVRSADRGNAR